MVRRPTSLRYAVGACAILALFSHAFSSSNPWSEGSPDIGGVGVPGLDPGRSLLEEGFSEEESPQGGSLEGAWREPQSEGDTLKDSMDDLAPSQQPARRASREKKASSDKVMICSLKVIGTKRIDPVVLTEQFPKKSDRRYSQADLDSYMKGLFETGLFSDVSLSISGSTLTVSVVETRAINRVVFEGNKDLGESDFKNVVTIKPRDRLIPARVQEEIQRIKAFYRIKGRFAAKVTPKTIKRDQDRVDLIFEIQEGPKTHVEAIFFTGNQAFDQTTLSEVITTREKRWYRFWGNDDVYDSERVRYDCELLRQFYLKNGYADFRVIISSAELSPYGEFAITYAIEEGKRYRFGETLVRSEVKGVDITKLKKKITWKCGDWFDHMAVQSMTEFLAAELSREGISFADVVPIPNQNRKTGTMGISFVIKPSTPRYIGKIHIVGNEGTDDKVIRRELAFTERSPINQANLSESERNLEGLDYFDSVTITEHDTGSPWKKDLFVTLKEKKSTGDLKFGGGYSSADGPIGNLNFYERNFLGKGWIVDLNSFFARRGFSIDGSFTEPWFLGRRCPAGVELFHNSFRGDTRGDFKSGGYNQRTTGGIINFGYMLFRNTFQNWSYKISRDHLALRATDDSSPYLTINRPTNFISGLTHDLACDVTRRIAGDPYSGFFMKVTNTITGFGGSVSYVSNTVIGAGYFSFDEKKRWILRAQAKYGAVIRLKYLRFADRFYLGEQTFAGFREAGIGPRDMTTGDALGGRQYYVASLKLTFPLGPLSSPSSEIGPMKGFVMAQMGSLWDSGCVENPKDDPKNPGKKKYLIGSNNFFNRAVIGAGVVWRSPFGLLGVGAFKILRAHPCDRSRKSLMLIYGQDL